MDGPCGVTAVNDAGVWRIFISNGNLNPSNPIFRLDFGSSLLNTFTTTGLGNLGNVIGGARTLTLMKDCDQAVGYITDGTNHTLVKVDFHNDLTSIPTATNLGNLAGWNFPHSLSILFRVGADIYTFVPDAFASTITRLRFPRLHQCKHSQLYAHRSAIGLVGAARDIPGRSHHGRRSSHPDRFLSVDRRGTGDAFFAGK